MLSLFVVLSDSWGPAFHQIIARDFSLEYFPDISDRQRDHFLMGSVYADGLDKSITHYLPLLRAKINRVYDSETDIYWFLLGVYSHIPPDTFAHAGKSRSFITAAGIKHSISELVVDSLIVHTNPVTRFTLPTAIREELLRLEIRSNWKFGILYFLVHWIAKLPFYHFLPKIEQDRCPKPNLAVCRCNFRKHYEAMMQALRESMPLVLDSEFNDVRMKELATRLLFDVECCESDRVNITVEDPLMQGVDLPEAVSL
jgi:hypothetical protein